MVTAGSYFVLAMLDKLWHQNLTEEEAFQLHMKGVDEVKKRLVVAPPDFIIKVCRSLGILHLFARALSCMFQKIGSHQFSRVKLCA